MIRILDVIEIINENDLDVRNVFIRAKITIINVMIYISGLVMTDINRKIKIKEGEFPETLKQCTKPV